MWLWLKSQSSVRLVVGSGQEGIRFTKGRQQARLPDMGRGPMKAGPLVMASLVGWVALFVSMCTAVLSGSSRDSTWNYPRQGAH